MSLMFKVIRLPLKRLFNLKTRFEQVSRHFAYGKLGRPNRHDLIKSAISVDFAFAMIKCQQ